NHVSERVLDHLKHLPVEFGVSARHVELNLLVELERKLAHESRQLLPSIGDRLHAGLHDAVLQLGGDIGEALQRHLELAVAGTAHDVEQLIAREHELAHRRHQVFERVDRNADRLRTRLAILGVPPGRSVSRPGSFWLLEVGPRRFAPGALELVEARADRMKTAVLIAEMNRSHTGVARNRKRLQFADQLCVRAPGFDTIALETFEDELDAVDAFEDEAYAFDGDGSAVAILPHQRFGSVGELGEPRQAEKPARAFDRVYQPENGVEHLGIVRVLLEANQLKVELVETLAGLGQEFTQELVHESIPARGMARAPKPPQATFQGLSADLVYVPLTRTRKRPWGDRFVRLRPP